MVPDSGDAGKPEPAGAKIPNVGLYPGVQPTNCV